MIGDEGLEFRAQGLRSSVKGVFRLDSGMAV